MIKLPTSLKYTRIFELKFTKHTWSFPCVHFTCNHYFCFWKLQTALPWGEAVHLFKLHKTFTASDESDLSLNMRKSTDPSTSYRSTWPRNKMCTKKRNVSCLWDRFVWYMIKLIKQALQISSVILCNSGLLINLRTVLIWLSWQSSFKGFIVIGIFL